ncbi:MAG: hypothetical protein FWG68_04410 [Defluviitaleaceae bacterium]|nr:hypothetical protein [Defluviitaleaceae bacterium]
MEFLIRPRNRAASQSGCTGIYCPILVLRPSQTVCGVVTAAGCSGVISYSSQNAETAQLSNTNTAEVSPVCFSLKTAVPVDNLAI